MWVIQWKTDWHLETLVLGTILSFPITKPVWTSFVPYLVSF